jgi:pimeloyl-ACP methyl ester carboxylesterase
VFGSDDVTGVCMQVHGEQDRLVPIGNSCRLSAVLGGAPVVKIAGCGHNPMEELPECFISEVCRFVDTTVRPRLAAASV